MKENGHKSQFAIMLSAEKSALKNHSQWSVTIPAYLQLLGFLMQKRNSKEDHPNCFRKKWLHNPPPLHQPYSHNAYATSLSLILSFFSVMRGAEPIPTRENKSWYFLIFLPVQWALGSLLEEGSESQQAGDHPTHPHHSSTLEPAWNNIPVNIVLKVWCVYKTYFQISVT